MADYCVSDPTAGCENTLIISGINDCCAETNSNLEAIHSKLTEMLATQVECCQEMNDNLTEMIRLLGLINNKL